MIEVLPPLTPTFSFSGKKGKFLLEKKSHAYKLAHISKSVMSSKQSISWYIKYFLPTLYTVNTASDVRSFAI